MLRITPAKRCDCKLEIRYGGHEAKWYADDSDCSKQIRGPGCSFGFTCKRVIEEHPEQFRTSRLIGGKQIRLCKHIFRYTAQCALRVPSTKRHHLRWIGVLYSGTDLRSDAGGVE